MRGPVNGTCCHLSTMQSAICFEDFKLTNLIPVGFWRDSFGFVAHPNRTVATKAAENGSSKTANGFFHGFSHCVFSEGYTHILTGET